MQSAALIPSLELPVAISQNGQQFSPSHATFTYLRPPVLSAVSPSSGPTRGDTRVVISGHNLIRGDDYRCRFSTFSGSEPVANGTVQATLTTPSQLTCTSPPLPSVSLANLRISLNGQQFSEPLRLGACGAALR